jgi:Ring finger domain
MNSIRLSIVGDNDEELEAPHAVGVEAVDPSAPREGTTFASVMTSVDAVRRLGPAGPFLVLMLLKLSLENARHMLVLLVALAVLVRVKSEIASSSKHVNVKLRALVSLAAACLLSITFLQIIIHRLSGSSIMLRLILCGRRVDAESLTSHIYLVAVTDLCCQLLAQPIKALCLLIAPNVGHKRRHNRNLLLSSSGGNDCTENAMEEGLVLRKRNIVGVPSPVSSPGRESDTPDAVTSASDDEVDIYQHMYISKAFSVIDVLSLLYRSILPLPGWFIFFSGGTSAYSLSALYVAVKMVYLFPLVLAFREVIINLCRSDRLEFGRLLTPHEVAENQSGCPICFESVLIQGVVLECRHAFCFRCINEWLANNNNCPVCRRDCDQDGNSHYSKQMKEASRSIFPVIV